MSFRFEKLEVWHKSIAFADCVCLITRGFPDSERFGLVTQMRRAAVSISSNIAEGSGRGSDKDFARFLEISYGSLMETISQTHIAKRQEFVKQEVFNEIHILADELTRMLSGLRNSLQE